MCMYVCNVHWNLDFTVRLLSHNSSFTHLGHLAGCHVRCRPARQEQFGVWYLPQGHFAMQTRGIEPATPQFDQNLPFEVKSQFTYVSVKFTSFFPPHQSPPPPPPPPPHTHTHTHTHTPCSYWNLEDSWRSDRFCRFLTSTVPRAFSLHAVIGQVCGGEIVDSLANALIFHSVCHYICHFPCTI